MRLLINTFNSSFCVRLAILSSITLFSYGFVPNKVYAQIEAPCEEIGNCPPKVDTPSANPQSQSDSQDSLQELKDRLEKLKIEAEIVNKQAEIAEKEKSIAESDKNKFKASLPESTITPVNGDIINPEKIIIENEIIAYNELDKVSRSITNSIIKKIPAQSSILIHDDTLIAKASSYGLLYRFHKQELNYLTELYKNQFEIIQKAKDDNKLTQEQQVADSQSLTTVLRTPSIATSFLKQIAEFTSLFKQDTTLNTVAINIPKDVLVSQIAANLQSSSSSNITIYDPKLNSINLEKLIDFQNSLDILYKHKLEAIKAILELEKNYADNEIRANLIDELSQLNKQFDESIDKLLELNQETKKPLFILLLEGATIDEFLSQENSYMLHLTLKVEGSYRLRKNIFTGTNLRRSSGVAVNYILLNKKGKLLDSNMLYSNSPYIKGDEITNNVDN
jgi:hypothetical protein